MPPTAIPATCRPTLRTVASDSIHTYFDVCPESPDGRHLCWFRFDGKPLCSGTVMLGRRGAPAAEAVAVLACAGQAHVGAHQGWVDDGHVFFSAEGQVQIADLTGRIVARHPGAIDTIHQGSRRGLLHSAGWATVNGLPGEEACYRLDLDTGALTTLLRRAEAVALLSQHRDLSAVPTDTLGFKHTKWSPDGQRWFVVFTNEGHRRSRPELPRVKVLLQADADGGGLRLIGSFGHHPNWLPDGSGIYAFGDQHDHRLMRWGLDGGEPTVLAVLPIEGHPCVSPDGTSVVTDGHLGPDDMRVVRQDLATGAWEILSESPWPKVDWQTQHPPHRICHAHPVWSHDGRRLYVNAVAGEMPELRVVDWG